MTVASVGEFGVIARVSALLRPPPPPAGPGDDAAVVLVPDGRVVATTDVLVEGVHFRLDWSTPTQVGRKAAAASLADVAAMGGTATSLLVALVAPGSTPLEVTDGFAIGLGAEASLVGARVVGGDTASGPVLVLSVTALGDLGGRPPITRGGAAAGDTVVLVGRVGWSAAGLDLLRAGITQHPCVTAHRTPEPPYAWGPRFADLGATALIDISDGVAADLGHVARASGVQVALNHLPLDDEVADAASRLGVDPLPWLLGGGEDHALVACLRPGTPLPEGCLVIGHVVDGEGVTLDGAPVTGGWEHFG